MYQTKRLEETNRKIINCKKCPRLATYIRKVAKDKVKRFSDQKYWGLPLPGFGDVNCQLLIIGLAPAAHGGNRTGRMFTGDSSGDWLAKTLYQNGFANQDTSHNVQDGFCLYNAYITAAVRCAPPENKPTKSEMSNCSEYLKAELEILKEVKIILCLGRVAFEACSKTLNIKAQFSHANLVPANTGGNNTRYTIMCSYHPSRQNTQTGRLLWNDWNKVFERAARLLSTNKTG